MHVYETGSEGKKALVILHGWGLDGAKYHELAKILSKQYWVIVPDLPGFGKSKNPPRPYTVDNFSKRVKKMLKEKKISEACFIGHSFGGRILIKMSNKYPKLVKSIILTGAPGVEAFLVRRTGKRMLYWILAKGLKWFSFIPIVKKWKRNFYKDRDFGKVEGIMKETFLNIIGEKLEKEAKKIQNDTLLLWGAKDSLTPVQDAKKMLKIIPNSYLKIFTRVGHRLPYEKPHEFAREVIHFLSLHS